MKIAQVLLSISSAARFFIVCSVGNCYSLLTAESDGGGKVDGTDETAGGDGSGVAAGEVPMRLRIDLPSPA